MMSSITDIGIPHYDITCLKQWDAMEEELDLMDLDSKVKEKFQLQFQQKKSEMVALVHSLRDRAISCEEWVRVTSRLTRKLTKILLSVEKSHAIFERQQALLKGEETLFQAMTVKVSRRHFESAINKAAFDDELPCQEIKTVRQAHRVASHFIPDLKSSAFSRACTFLGADDIMDGVVTLAVSECITFAELSFGAALEVPLAVPIAASMLLGTAAKAVLPRFKENTVFTHDQHVAWKLIAAHEGLTLAGAASTIELILHGSEYLGSSVEKTLKKVSSRVTEVVRLYCDHFGFTAEKRILFKEECEKYVHKLREDARLA